MTLPRVTRRSNYARFFVLNVEVPRTGVTSVPLRLTADADEVPDDAPEETEYLMIRVALLRR